MSTFTKNSGRKSEFEGDHNEVMWYLLAACAIIVALAVFGS